MVSADGPMLAVERDGRWYRWTPPEDEPLDSSWSAVDVLAIGERLEADNVLHSAHLLPPDYSGQKCDVPRQELPGACRRVFRLCR